MLPKSVHFSFVDVLIVYLIVTQLSKLEIHNSYKAEKLLQALKDILPQFDHQVIYLSYAYLLPKFAPSFFSLMTHTYLRNH